jgi:photosystem II stability/assembly factor-like uncharacterized protein
MPARAYCLALARAGQRLVAACERGVILLSDDAGASWRQAKVPVSVTLTAVAFPTATGGWAAGHAGVVLHTDDAGESWTKQLDGVTAARLAFEAAAAGHNSPLQTRMRQLLADGPDKPFLDLHFDDDRHGFVAGAYGLLFGTDDGGTTWQSWMDRVDNPSGRHLNAIAVEGDVLYLAGEQGTLFRSDDGGRSFVRLDVPGKGSLFAVVAGPASVVVAGLKGGAFVSEDRGKTFARFAVPAATIVHGERLEDGRFVFVNQAGELLVSADQGQTVQVLSLPPGSAPTAALPAQDGAWIVAGARGVARAAASPISQ